MKGKVVSELASRAHGLRNRAQALRALGQDEEGLRLFRDAVQCFAADDDGPEASAARHDLGEAYREYRPGSRMENLLQAERLLRRAYASPARTEDPRRMAMTASSLASTLRQQSMLPGHDSETLLNEAMELLTEAVRIAESFDSHLDERARYFDTLGNLYLQRGDLDEALRLNRKAVQAAAAWVYGFPKSPEARRECATYKCHLMLRLVLRGRRADLREALTVATTLRRDVPDAVEELLDLCEARVLCAIGGAEHRARARDLLAAARADGIPPNHFFEFVRLLAELGRRDLAITYVRNSLHDALAERREARADYLADHASAKVYAAGRRLAALYLDGGEPLEAFLALENASGLRYEDALGEYACVASTPLGRALEDLETVYRTGSAMIEDLGGMLAHVPEEALQAILTDMLAGLATGTIATHSSAVRAASDALMRIELPEMLREALATSDLGAVFRRCSDEMARRAHAVDAAIAQHEPTRDHNPGRLGFAVEPADLSRILGEQPRTVFLRVLLEPGALVAIGVALVGGAPTARCARIEVPMDLLAQVSAVAEVLTDIGQHHAEVVRLATTLAAMDLSAALPEGTWDALVLLPDQLSAMLPLGALGPPGATPIERFAAVTWLPCLGPLRCRQVETRPRSGQTTLLPFSELWPEDEGTLAGEVFALDEDATHARLMAATADADVVCMLTHGQHTHGTWPEIQLFDGLFAMTPLQGPGWVGIERIEIWACESGVDVPGDPRGAMTNEFFGVDGILLQHGARSAIGTLWQVSAPITGAILRRYRAALRSGLPADRALVAAQRWWIGDGVDEWLRDYPERALWRELLTNPTIWAGYRFVGVCERRPERRVERPTPLSASDEAIVEAVIASLDEHGEDLSDIIERELDELDDALADGVPTPAQSQRASQLYRARVLSSYGHNQLCALAWLHEGIRIATPASRGALVRDAARLWLWFALRETPEALYIGAQGPTPERAAARGRAAQLLGELPPADYVAEWGMLEVLAAAEQREPAALGRAVETVCAALELAAPRLDLGALAIACWVAAMDVKAAGRHAAALLAVVRSRARELSSAIDQIGDASLVAWTGRLLARGMNVTAPVREPSQSWLPAPMLCAAAIDELQQLAVQRDTSDKARLIKHSEAMTDLEGRLWDHPRGDGTRLWRSTGSAGAAYRRVAGWYLRGAAAIEHADRHITLYAASLQFFADLRLLVRARLACAVHLTRRVDANRSEMYAGLWRGSSQSGQQMDQLAAVASLPGSEQLSRPDPFKCTPRAVRARFVSVADLPVWELAQFEQEDDDDPRTLAFRTVRAVETARRQISLWWDELRKAGSTDPLWQILQPGTDIAFNQRALTEIPDETGLLTCMFTPAHEVLLAVVWRDRGTLVRRTLLRGEGLGVRVRHLATALIRPGPEELDGQHGPARQRGEQWAHLHESLAPLLAELLSDAPEGLRLAVFTPGGPRPLPWLALMPDRVVGVWQVPALGWWPAGAPGRTACWFDAAGDSARTSHGEVVIAGLRALWPPEAVLGAPDHRGTDVPEAQQVERTAASGAVRLRFYGVGFADGVTDREAGLRLGGSRAFVDRNLAETCFGPGSEVEMWTATPCIFGWSRYMLDDGDRIPGLAHSFLGCGATAVLDLAWPVHDLIKALVCEHYSLLRGTRAVDGAVALAAAVRWCRRVMALLRERGPSTHEAALAVLDGERQQTAKLLGVAESAILSLPRAPIPTDLDAWITEVTTPSHLAAFRWWGTCAVGPVGEPQV